MTSSGPPKRYFAPDPTEPLGSPGSTKFILSLLNRHAIFQIIYQVYWPNGKSVSGKSATPPTPPLSKTLIKKLLRFSGAGHNEKRC